MDFYSHIIRGQAGTEGIEHPKLREIGSRYKSPANNKSHANNLSANTGAVPNMNTKDNLTNHCNDLNDRYSALVKEHTALNQKHSSLSSEIRLLRCQNEQLKIQMDQKSLNQDDSTSAKLAQELKQNHLTNAKLAEQVVHLQERLRLAESSQTNNSEKLAHELKQTHLTNAKLAEQVAHLQERLRLAQDTTEKNDAKQRQQLKVLKDTVESLAKSCEAASEKMLLQKQLHYNQMRTTEAAHKTISARCTALATSADLHRQTNLKLEERHKSLCQDLNSMAQKSASLEAELKSKNHELSTLKTAHENETKRLQASLQKAQEHLQSHPVSMEHILRSKSILESSADVLELAHDNGGVESMRQCLREVANVLKDLGEDLTHQHRLASEWLSRAGLE